MNLRLLTSGNIRFFARYYRLVALAVLITTAVITGSLVVGHSVRSTLVGRAEERLGNTETVLFSRNSFMSEEMADAFISGGQARGILLTNGFLSRNGRLIPVFVWGVNDLSIARGAARFNPALLKEAGPDHPDAIVLRLPASGLVPSGSLFVTDNYTTSLRLSFDGLVDVAEGGNISMKNEQTLPLNIFMNREELAEAMQAKGKINLILSAGEITAGELDSVWNYTASGLRVTPRGAFTEITSDRVFLQDQAVETICRDHTGANRMFSYLANAICRGGQSIPYSFVTASDRYNGIPLLKDEIILSDYSAQRLQARPGDTVRVVYFTSKDLKTLRTDSLLLRVKDIVPIGELASDRTLSADFPGLSDVERCTDWDSDLPIDMNLITDEDERYWELYRTTPKAIIAYEAIAGRWSNEYGSATAVRIPHTSPDLSGLRADMFGIQLIRPREAALHAATHGVDFAGLFLALGFFIVVSSVLLMLVPVSEMLYRRRRETDLLKALGYPPKRIVRILWMESAPVVLVSSVAGVLAGLVYTTLIMWLLGNVWKGATHTEGFSVYPDGTAMLGGFLVGIGLSLCLLRMAIGRSLKEKRPGASGKKQPLRGKKALAILFTVMSAGSISANFLFLHSVALFVVAGILLIGTAAVWGDYLICRNVSPLTNHFDTARLTGSTLFAGRKQALLSFFALTTGVFIVFSVGLNRKGFADSSQIRTGTGGYSLWCESTVPLYHNISTRAGREKLSLTGLPEHAGILQCLRYGADEASCLNLNKVTTPTVLGVDMNALSASDLRIEQSLYPPDRNTFFARMQEHTQSVYPAIVDETVLTWSLGMSLGDTLWYESDAGRQVAIRLVGTLSNSIFQGNILIDRSLFAGIWQETTGSELFLLKVREEEETAVKTLVSQALNEYGVKVTTTADRLRQFNTVTDTYLTIFMTLGGIGVLLGIMSFVIVIRKGLATRRTEIDTYRALGFPDSRIEQILYRENLLVPLYAIAAGVLSSLAAASISLMNTNLWIWLMALLFTLLFVAGVIVFVRQSVKNELYNYNTHVL